MRARRAQFYEMELQKRAEEAQKVLDGGINPFLEAALAQRVGVDAKEGREAG